MATLGIPQNTIAILQKYNFMFQKRYGQNFLIDTRVLDKIISASGITKDDMILEVGPGIGTMTQYLCESARKVIAVEIDKNLIPILENDTLKEYDKKIVNFCNKLGIIVEDDSKYIPIYLKNQIPTSALIYKTVRCIYSKILYLFLKRYFYL